MGSRILQEEEIHLNHHGLCWGILIWLEKIHISSIQLFILGRMISIRLGRLSNIGNLNKPYTIILSLMEMLVMGNGEILGKMKNPYPSLLMVSLTLHSVIKMIQSTFMLSRSIEYLNSYPPKVLKSLDSIPSGIY